jgi:hypothetical protein
VSGGEETWWHSAVNISEMAIFIIGRACALTPLIAGGVIVRRASDSRLLNEAR